jgi:putative DNA methylase
MAEISLKKKLIEVALSLEAMNKESIREGFIYRGNPSAIHKWWSRNLSPQLAQ